MGPGTTQPFQSLFTYSTGKLAVDILHGSWGTPTSGPLGALFVSFFLMSLMWVWVKNKFDTWSLWDVFLRATISAAGLFMWNSLFLALNNAMDYTALLFGTADPNAQIADILYMPFQQMGVVQTFIYLLTPDAILKILGMLLYDIAFLMYNISIAGQFITTTVLYLVGPLFLCCYVFDPLQDLWMKWVRFYLTVKVWYLVLVSFIWVVDMIAASNLPGDMVNSGIGWINIDAYLFMLIVGMGSAFPIARALTGGAASTFFSGNAVPAVAGAGVATVATVGGLAAGSAGGPGGAMVGGAVGGAVGGTSKNVIVPKREA